MHHWGLLMCWDYENLGQIYFDLCHSKANCSTVSCAVMQSRDPSTNVVLLEDAAAVLGVILAASCMGLTSLTGKSSSLPAWHNSSKHDLRVGPIASDTPVVISPGIVLMRCPVCTLRLYHGWDVNEWKANIICENADILTAAVICRCKYVMI